MIENQQVQIEEDLKDIEDQIEVQNEPTPSLECPYRKLTGHWLTISRPQYKRTCGLSSLISIWNYQFSRLGLGNKQPISIEQAMLKLNVIGNGSMEQNFRKKFKKTAELTQKQEKVVGQQQQDVQISRNNKSLFEYIDSVDFGVFTGNDTLMRWYRILCRIYGGSGRAYIHYKTNSDRSRCKDELEAKRGLVEGLNSEGKTCFIYHAYDHYFCPVGYEYTPSEGENDEGTFESKKISLEDNLCVLVGESSKMFSCVHSFNWSDIQLDLTTYWPKKFNIRRPKEGVTIGAGKEQEPSKNTTINCIMAFQKLRD